LEVIFFEKILEWCEILLQKILEWCIVENYFGFPLVERCGFAYFCI